jgi:hypothetical protein
VKSSFEPGAALGDTRSGFQGMGSADHQLIADEKRDRGQIGALTKLDEPSSLPAPEKKRELSARHRAKINLVCLGNTPTSPDWLCVPSRHSAVVGGGQWLRACYTCFCRVLPSDTIALRPKRTTIPALMASQTLNCFGRFAARPYR